MAVREPQTLLEAVRYFADPGLAFTFVKDLRWADGVVRCPRCGHDDPSFLSTRRIWKCKGCKRQFSLKVGTIFEDSPLGWDKWLPAVWLIANSKNSISSHELGRALGVTQKTAWFMLHRIRLAMKSRSLPPQSGPAEVDETYLGGKAANMHAKRRRVVISGRGNSGKVGVQGVRWRLTQTVDAQVLTGQALVANVEKWIEPGSTVYTDDARPYRQLRGRYTHETVMHDHEYVRGPVHTNGIENFWALLKRAIKGTQVHVNPEHVQRYVVERVFSYNKRGTDDLGRMRAAMKGTPGRRLTWDQLTLKV